jgi:4-alpha-glucanotransferase
MVGAAGQDQRGRRVAGWRHLDSRFLFIYRHSILRSSPARGESSIRIHRAQGAAMAREAAKESPELFPRCNGVLLHPTSLPGPSGVGELGPVAHRFVDWLVEAHQSLWQVLPLGPTGFGDSPYQTRSAFAGNPLLISGEDLHARGWLTRDDLEAAALGDGVPVDFGAVIACKNRLLRRAWELFSANASRTERDAHDAWCARTAAWLDDYVLFTVLRRRHGGASWSDWPQPLALREPAELGRVARELADELAEQRFRQWIFFDQWNRLHDYAGKRGVRIFGDLPIFVAYDSADVWAHRELFRLDERGRPEAVAGVPPDYFSETGQLWGNPLYDWDRMAARGFAWWGDRLAAGLELFDLVRIDHFRGFEAGWEVPADAETAVGGRWRPAPGDALLHALAQRCGRLPVVAEDLGVITPEVEALRDRFALPGMKVLQFAWDDPCSPHLPHNHRPNTVLYAGTHDNPTTRSWWAEALDAERRDRLRDYVGLVSGGAWEQEPHWLLIRLGMMSVAHTFVVTLQDVLGLGAEARMNTPGSPSGNWSWRAPADFFTHPAGERLADLSRIYERAPAPARTESEP